MAIRIRSALISQRSYESLWANCPPTFLAPTLRPFSTTKPTAVTTQHLKSKKRVNRDAYTLRQAQQRKDANISRQVLIKEQTRREFGDPIRGIETDFVRSFDADITQGSSEGLESSNIDLDALKARPDQPPPFPTQGSRGVEWGHGTGHAELQDALQYSNSLTEPIHLTEGTSEEQPQQGGSKQQEWQSRSENAFEAVQKIVNLMNGNSMHRTKKNVERVVAELGRHTTDNVLNTKAAANLTKSDAPASIPRAGPDTGSSEVQIGILTAKIRVLANRYEGEAKQDKVNKRNLRLLLHRRQKLLRYMERKERGSGRWTNMLQTLGLTPATWRGEISVE